MSATVSITLPVSLNDWAQEQATQAGYSSVAEYVGELLRREQQRVLRASIDAKLLEALDSGPATPMTQKDWDRIRQEGRKQLSAGNKRKQA